MAVDFIVRANSLKQEIYLIWDKIKMMDFFVKHRYQIELPDHPLVKELVEKSLQNNLQEEDYHKLSNVMEKQVYNIDDYTAGIKAIKARIDSVMLDFSCFNHYHKLWGFNSFNSYTISLTLYGPGGEYRPFTGEVIMLTTKDGTFRRGIDPLGTLIHEIVHIGIEMPVIQPQAIPHITKEQIVDHFVASHFKEILPHYHIQNFGDNPIPEYFKTPEDWENINETIMKMNNE